jgi:hypothetical protein
MPTSLSPNTDPLAITMPVNVAAQALYALESFAGDCGIALGDESEPINVAIRALQAALATVPFLTLSGPYDDGERGGEDGCASYRQVYGSSL